MDDMLPNDGSTFHMFDRTEEQKRDERRSLNEAESSYPVLDRLIELLENQIDATDSIRALGIDASMSSTERDIRFLSRAQFADLCTQLLSEVRDMKEAVDKQPRG